MSRGYFLSRKNTCGRHKNVKGHFRSTSFQYIGVSLSRVYNGGFLDNNNVVSLVEGQRPEYRLIHPEYIRSNTMNMCVGMMSPY